MVYKSFVGGIFYNVLKIICFFVCFIKLINKSKTRLLAIEHSEEQVAQIVRATYLKVSVNNKKVKMTFKEPFATIEKLLKLAKKEITEIGLSEFKSAIISSKDRCIESIKKETLIGLLILMVVE